MGQTPHTLLSLRGYLYSLRGEEPLRPTAYGAAAGRRGLGTFLVPGGMNRPAGRGWSGASFRSYKN